MSKTFKKLDEHKRVQEKDLYFRSDRRASKDKSEKDAFFERTDMGMKRSIRRNDNWQRQVNSALVEMEKGTSDE